MTCSFTPAANPTGAWAAIGSAPNFKITPADPADSNGNKPGYYIKDQTYSCTVGSGAAQSVAGISVCDITKSAAPTIPTQAWSASSLTIVSDLSTWFNSNKGIKSYSISCTQGGNAVSSCPYTIDGIKLVRATSNSGSASDTYAVTVTATSLCSDSYTVAQSAVSITQNVQCPAPTAKASLPYTSTSVKLNADTNGNTVIVYNSLQFFYTWASTCTQAQAQKYTPSLTGTNAAKFNIDSSWPFNIKLPNQ